MKILVVAKPNAKFNKVESTEAGYKIWTKEVPVDGKANLAILQLLAAHLKIPRSSLRLISGARGKRKVFELF